MRRLVPAILSGLLIAVVLGAAAFVFYPQPLLQRILAAALGRDVTIEAAGINLDAGAVVTLFGLRVPDARPGSTTDLLRIATLTATLDLASLLAGGVHLPQVTIDGLRLSLERDPDGRGNWKQARTPAPANPRPWLPTILDLTMRDSGLQLRTSGGGLLDVFAQNLTLRTDGHDRPVSLAADIVYNDTPIDLSARLESFDAYRDRTRRFGFALAATTAAGRLDLNGNADAPLDFDALAGELRADIPDIGRLVTVFGSDLNLQVPLTLSGSFAHDGDAWRLTAARGTLAGGSLSGELVLDEGARLQPDTVRTAVELADLDLDLMLDRLGKTPATRSGATRIEVDAHPGVLLDARLGIARLGWRDAGITNLRLHAEVAPGRLALNELAFNVGGGRITGGVSAEAASDMTVPDVAAHVEIDNIEARQLLHLAGIQTAALGGRLNGQARIAAAGATAAAATRTAKGQIVLTMNRGQIAREVMLLASTDIRRLFGPVSGTSPVSCLLAIMHVQNGVGMLAPLRIRSGIGTLLGGGAIDFNREILDLTIRTVNNSTAFFALDIPIRIVGPINNPTIRPAIDLDTQTLTRQLPEPMRTAANASPCVR